MDNSLITVPEQSWFIFDLYTPQGGKITIKESDPTKLNQHLTDLLHGLTAFMTENKGFSLRPPELPAAPKQNVTVVDEQGNPAKDKNGQAVEVDLPEGTHLFDVASLFHDQTKTGKDVLKVVTVQPPYNTKYGVSCFHGGPAGWKDWPIGIDNKYRPAEGFTTVIIRDPKKDGGYADVVEFRP